MTIEELIGRFDKFKKDVDDFFNEITAHYRTAFTEMQERQIRLSCKESELLNRESGMASLVAENKSARDRYDAAMADIEQHRLKLAAQEKELAKIRQDAENAFNEAKQCEFRSERRVNAAIEKEAANNQKEKDMIEKESSLMALKKELSLLQAKLNEK